MFFDETITCYPTQGSSESFEPKSGAKKDREKRTINPSETSNSAIELRPYKAIVSRSVIARSVRVSVGETKRLPAIR